MYGKKLIMCAAVVLALVACTVACISTSDNDSSALATVFDQGDLKFSVVENTLDSGMIAGYATGKDDVGELTFPATVNFNGLTYKVKEVKSGAFSHQALLKKVRISGENMEVIGENAFIACSKLNSFEFGSKIKTIGKSAFSGCKSLESVSIGDQLTYLGASAFQGCEKLRNVELNTDACSEILERTFYGCKLLETIVFPNEVDTIGKEAFQGCVALRAFKMTSNTLNVIGEGAFRECTAMTDLWIPGPVTEVQKEAFMNCHRITKINFFGDAMPTIGTGAFHLGKDNDNKALAEVYTKASVANPEESFIQEVIGDFTVLSFHELPVMFSVVITKNGNGTIDPDYGIFEKDTSVTFTLTPSAGHTVESLKVNGTAVELNNNKYTMKVTQDVAMLATFVEAPPAPQPSGGDSILPIVAVIVILVIVGVAVAAWKFGLFPKKP